MAPRDRSEGRNAHIYNTSNRTTVLGGIILTNGITNANFYSMVEIIVLFTSSFDCEAKEMPESREMTVRFNQGTTISLLRVSPLVLASWFAKLNGS
jgi:hypothetical protein